MLFIMLKIKFMKAIVKLIYNINKKIEPPMEGTEKVPFGIKDLKNFFKTIF